MDIFVLIFTIIVFLIQLFIAYTNWSFDRLQKQARKKDDSMKALKASVKKWKREERRVKWKHRLNL